MFRNFNEIYSFPVFFHFNVYLRLLFSLEYLHELFSTYGTIASLYYPTDLKTFKSRNFAFVRYLDESSAVAAAESLQGMPLGKLINGSLASGFCIPFIRIHHFL